MLPPNANTPPVLPKANRPDFGALAQAFRTPQGQEQLIDQLAKSGPPPAVAPQGVPQQANLVGTALEGLQKGLAKKDPRGNMLPQLRKMPMTRGEASTNPPSIGGLLAQEY